MADPTSTRSRAINPRLARRLQDQETLDSSDIPRSYQSSQGAYNYASLRSPGSRFSLHEQFAATRQEYEFDYDDASSIWGGTIRSGQFDELDAAGAPFPSSEGIVGPDPVVTSPPFGGSDFYDVLCVSRDSSAENIRRAYLRLFSLLDPDKQPPFLRHIAEDYFMIIQTAFETLLDPCQRARYNLDSHDGGLMSSDALEAQENHDRIAQMARRLAINERRSGIWELDARFDIQQVAKNEKHDSEQGEEGVGLVDLEMNHAVSFDMNELDSKFCRMVQRLQHFASGDKTINEGLRKQAIAGRLDGTVMTFRGSVYGLLQDRVPVSYYSFDRHQLSFPHATNRDQFSLLRNGLVRPLFAINLRHAIPRSYHDQSTTRMTQTSILENDVDQEETVVEIESIVLPEQTTTVRLSKSIVLPFDKQTSYIILEAEQGLLRRKLPRLSTTLERPTAEGQLLIHISSGDWQDRQNGTYRYLADFTGINRILPSIGMLGNGRPDGLSRHIPPRVEIAFKTRGAFESQESRIGTRSRNQGICALDVALDRDEEGAWTVTALAEPQYCLVSAKYAQDVDLSTLRLPRPPSLSPKNSKPLSTVVTSTTRRRFRVEAEIGTGSFSAGYLAFRCLKRVGRLSKLGFEMGLSRYSLHLSVYWSRLGHRINVPFYLSSRSSVNVKTFLLTTIVPFAGFALWELWDQRRGRKRCQQRLDMLQEQQYTQKRRTEADTLTSLMTPAVQNRQKLELLGNGLVILSAKYGVKARGASDATAWGAAEVADVTIPVAALVDRSRLLIPSGVRKSAILGFWDPEPAEEKVLHVRYSYQGKEATVEVRGDNEQLVLPPFSLP
ncbi:hypothetical protein F4859DRAFT_482162 [Xylaria cf. heliscus]|nr:hypothetical protein F4859DRAFT_482162 [Xylaria cf. heliscus]